MNPAAKNWIPATKNCWESITLGGGHFIVTHWAAAHPPGFAHGWGIHEACKGHASGADHRPVWPESTTGGSNPVWPGSMPVRVKSPSLCVNDQIQVSLVVCTRLSLPKRQSQGTINSLSCSLKGMPLRQKEPSHAVWMISTGQPRALCKEISLSVWMWGSH